MMSALKWLKILQNKLKRISCENYPIFLTFGTVEISQIVHAMSRNK